jgi:hypothetical protein
MEKHMKGTKTLYQGWLVISTLIAITAWIALSCHATAGGKEPQSVIHQLRIYEIFEGNKKEFHDRFRDHAIRIMARYDFKIVCTWEAKTGDRTEFVYLLEWPDKETMKDRWAKFMADQEWANIKKETRKYGSLVGKIEDRTLELTDYSPHKVLAK